MKKVALALLKLLSFLGLVREGIDIGELRRRDLNRVTVQCSKKRNAKILNVGCGAYGDTEKLLLAGGFENIDACDMLPCEKLADTFPNSVNYISLNIDKGGLDAYENESFDIVISTNVIEHLENPSMLFRGVSRILRADGIFILQYPNGFNLFERFYILFRGYPMYYPVEAIWRGHISLLPETLLTSLTRRYNLKYVSKEKGYAAIQKYGVFGCRPVDHLWSHNVMYVIKKDPV